MQNFGLPGIIDRRSLRQRSKCGGWLSRQYRNDGIGSGIVWKKPLATHTMLSSVSMPKSNRTIDRDVPTKINLPPGQQMSRPSSFQFYC